MSVAAKKWVERNPAAGPPSRQAVLEAIAWAAVGARGEGARISYREIAEKKRLGRNTVLRALAQLELDDRIRRHQGGPAHCDRCRTARRGVAVYDVVIPAPESEVSDGQMTLLTGPTARSDWPQMEPVVGPVLNPVQHHCGASSGSTVEPQGTYDKEHHQQESARELNDLSRTVDDVIALLERVEKPGWCIDRSAIEATVLVWPHRDPRRAAATVVAAARDHHHLNAAKLLGRALEWQRPDDQPPRRPPGRERSPEGPSAEFSKYDVAMGLAS